MHSMKNLMQQSRAFESIMQADAVEPAFLPMFEDCETHGRWQRNFLKGGVECWVPDCPQCRLDRLAVNLVKQAKIPKLFSGCTFESYHVASPEQDAVRVACRDYAHEFVADISQSPSMVFVGNPGTGKNHLSTAIIKTIMGNGFSALHITGVDYLDGYWSRQFAERGDWVKRLADIDLLVIDEIGRSSDSKAANDAMFRLINERYQAMKPTVLVSNLSKDALIDEIGVAAFDRLREFDGKLMVFSWGSYRAKTAKKVGVSNG